MFKNSEFIANENSSIIINKEITTLDDDRMSVVVNGDCDDILNKIMEKEI